MNWRKFVGTLAIYFVVVSFIGGVIALFASNLAWLITFVVTFGVSVAAIEGVTHEEENGGVAIE